MALIFQYGSNTSTTRLNSETRLRGDAKSLGLVRTEERFELAFTVWSKSNACAAADIVADHGRQIWGVLYEIPDWLISRETSDQRRSLDAIEGEGKNYLRREILLLRVSGERISALTYVAKTRQDGLRTSIAYAEHIIAGLKEHNAPNEYIQYVLERIAANNSSLISELNSLYNYVTPTSRNV